MEDQLISIETIRLAHEKGFDEGHSILSYEMEIIDDSLTCFIEDLKISLSIEEYSKKYNVCTQSLLQKWLREVHGIKVYLIPHPYSSRPDDWSYHVIKYTNGVVSEILDNEMEFKNFEQALEIGLQKALNLLPTKNPLE
jgi:hypothetical protein